MNDKKELIIESLKITENPTTMYATLTVHGTGRTKLNGYVAFFVGRDSDDITFVKAVGGKASFDIVTSRIQSIGAYTEDGTSLELDLRTDKRLAKAWKLKSKLPVKTAPPKKPKPKKAPASRAQKKPLRKKK